MRICISLRDRNRRTPQLTVLGVAAVPPLAIAPHWLDFPLAVEHLRLLLPHHLPRVTSFLAELELKRERLRSEKTERI